MAENLNSQTENSAAIRTGVILCGCGDKIAGCLDMPGLCQKVSEIPEVVFTIYEAYPCSKDGQVRLSNFIVEQNLNRVVVAGCTQRLIGKLFQQTVQSTGLQLSSLGIANIREQCTLVHPSLSQETFDKALNLIEIESARLANITTIPTTNGRIVKSALVLGSGISSLIAAVELAKADILVTLVEAADRIQAKSPGINEDTAELVDQYLETISNLPNLFILLDAQIQEVIGSPGDYQVSILHNGEKTRVSSGAILIGGDVQAEKLGTDKWVDRDRVKTQFEFENELNDNNVPQNIVMILCYGQTGEIHCSRLCCTTAIRQALHARLINPTANITLLFRELSLNLDNGAGEALLRQAVAAGITFFRYSKDHPPIITEKTVDIPDPLTNDSLKIPYDRAVVTTPLQPSTQADRLAKLLVLPQDRYGFISEPRLRLQPGHYVEDGIFALGGAHQPATIEETLFQGYLTVVKAERFLNQKTIHSKAAIAQVDSSLCTGCGECTQACLANAIYMEKRAEFLSISRVDPLRCKGCGSCAVACPVKAIAIPGWEDAAIIAQISAALNPSFRRQDLSSVTRTYPKIIMLACEWSAYAAADLAGASQETYPVNIRIIRLNCSARFDPNHALWALLNGAQGVMLGACPEGECHYGSGNLQARTRFAGLQRQLAEYGIDPRRLRLEFLTADDGKGLVSAIKNFARELSTISRLEAL